MFCVSSSKNYALNGEHLEDESLHIGIFKSVS